MHHNFTLRRMEDQRRNKFIKENTNRMGKHVIYQSHTALAASTLSCSTLLSEDLIATALINVMLQDE